MNTSTPLLTFVYTLDHPWPVRERTDVYPDGQLHHFVQGAMDPNRRNQAGQYVFQLSDTRLDNVYALARALLTLPPQKNQTRPEGVQVSLNVTLDNQSQSHSLSVGFPPTDPVLAEALQMGHTLLIAAMNHPLAVVKLSLLLRNTAIFVLENIGSESVQFLLQPEELALIHNEDQQTVWQNSEDTLMGLVDGLGRLVDGLHAAAILPPQSKATLALPALPPSISNPTTLRAILAGSITVTTHTTAPGTTTEAPFWLFSG